MVAREEDKALEIAIDRLRHEQLIPLTGQRILKGECNMPR